MKRIFLFIILLTVSMAVSAQNNEKLVSSINSAKEATLKPKKASKPATWMKLGDTYIDAYTSLLGSGWIGMSKNQAMILGAPNSSENVTFGKDAFTVDHYPTVDIYYNAQSVVEMMIVTDPMAKDGLLESARDSYLKAAEVDVKGSSHSKIKDKLMRVREAFLNAANSHYRIGNVKEAAVNYSQSVLCGDNKVVNSIDTLAIYYSGITFSAIGENEKAKEYYNRCIALNYKEGGNIPASLAEILKKEGKVEEAKKLLNEAFQEFPTSQAVLVNLINLYLDSNDDPQKILALIKTAQANEPTNATLIYAEGNIYKNLKEFDKALECYRKSYEVDPNYVFGIYSVGNTYYDMAISAQEAMLKIDINDVEGYEKALVKFEECLMKSMEPFETAFSKSNDKDMKIAAASALKQIYFRFRTKKPEYKEAFEKYNKFLLDNGIN